MDQILERRFWFYLREILKELGKILKKVAIWRKGKGSVWMCCCKVYSLKTSSRETALCHLKISCNSEKTPCLTLYLVTKWHWNEKSSMGFLSYSYNTKTTPHNILLFSQAFSSCVYIFQTCLYIHMGQRKTRCPNKSLQISWLHMLPSKWLLLSFMPWVSATSARI